jgi:hypothetical protein
VCRQGRRRGIEVSKEYEVFAQLAPLADVMKSHDGRTKKWAREDEDGRSLLVFKSDERDGGTSGRHQINRSVADVCRMPQTALLLVRTIEIVTAHDTACARDGIPVGGVIGWPIRAPRNLIVKDPVARGIVMGIGDALGNGAALVAGHAHANASVRKRAGRARQACERRHARGRMRAPRAGKPSRSACAGRQDPQQADACGGRNADRNRHGRVGMMP